MLKINISKQIEKFLQKLPSKQAKQIAKKIMALRLDPFPNDSKKIKNTDYLRVDIGEYRLIYQKNNETLNAVLLDKRNDDEIYKRFKRSVR